jgi:hypothetical protein
MTNGAPRAIVLRRRRRPPPVSCDRGRSAPHFTACEAASGAALAGAVAEHIMVTRLAVRDAQVECPKSATGPVVAGARLVDDSDRLLQDLQRDGRALAAVDVSAVVIDFDGNETLVARASFNWHLRLHAA